MKKGIKSSRLNFWGNLLLVLGFLSLIFFCFLVYQRNNSQNLSFNINDSKILDYKKSDSVSDPQGIIIDSAKIALDIYPAEIKDNRWESTSKGVSFLKTSAMPGGVGNSIMYGHNWSNLLGNLEKVKPGDKIKIVYKDNSINDFQIEYITKVNPDDISVLKNSEDSRLTLYTCTGLLDSKRLVVVAKLLKA